MPRNIYDLYEYHQDNMESERCPFQLYKEFKPEFEEIHRRNLQVGMDDIGDIFRMHKWDGDENSDSITPFGLGSKMFRKICKDILTIFNYYVANPDENLDCLVFCKDYRNTVHTHDMHLETLVARQFIIRHEVLIMDPRALIVALYGDPNKELRTRERLGLISAYIFSDTEYIESFVGFFPVSMKIRWADKRIDVVVTYFSRPMPPICGRYRDDLQRAFKEWEYQNAITNTVNQHGVDLAGFGTCVEVLWVNPDKCFGINAEDDRDRRGIRALFYTLKDHIGCQVEHIRKLEDTIELARKHDSAEEIFMETMRVSAMPITRSRMQF